jgi:hypothetical protein
MIKFILALSLTALVACGIDGDPIAPTPATATQ